MTSVDRLVPGRTTISARALEHLVTGMVRDAASARVRDIEVSLADAAGALRVSVTVPLLVGARPATPIFEQGALVRNHVIAGMKTLSGRAVGAVDVRYAGVRMMPARRVR
ncbi:hypothetical protein ET475_11090 [Microbacterium protaetiae]|uniref:Asp23/Gls24 family envelope stress response protein n=1 Tax=Microbacterium protaetiae TaxID=2509458 RepID=A0A4P6EFA5_9MICO|nr:hypothetical protein [Microbacterium protaetiae]QAY60476.1 hypothetical protein ET475_11090 [Microbacterium protaetiae]